MTEYIINIYIQVLHVKRTDVDFDTPETLSSAEADISDIYTLIILPIHAW